ncbi:MAG: DUF998 domain-containing protein [Streptosporangiales bacterium]|nr:DUF998 domain-containing protein [Streptosporangiales bacterium]
MTATQDDRAVPTAAPATRAVHVTRSLLGYGVIAGPIYLVTYLVQGLTRDGFDFGLHAASLLTAGSLGWIQVVNFVLTGAMIVAAAVGLRRAMPTGRGRIWGPLLLGLYGLGMVAAGVFPADPAFGFLAGTPDGPGTVSWHSLAHLSAGGVGFLGLVAACLVLARRFAGLGERGMAVFSVVTGVVFLAAFAGIASGSAGPVTTLPFVGAVALSFVWLATVSGRLYRRLAADC